MSLAISLAGDTKPPMPVEQAFFKKAQQSEAKRRNKAQNAAKQQALRRFGAVRQPSLEGSALVLTAQEARRYLNVSSTRIYQMLSEGLIEAEQIGRTWFIPKDPFFRRFGSPLPVSSDVPNDDEAINELGFGPVDHAPVRGVRDDDMGVEGETRSSDYKLTVRNPDLEATLSLRAASRKYSVTARRLKKAIDAGDLPVQYVGTRPYLAPAWVEKYLHGFEWSPKKPAPERGTHE